MEESIVGFEVVRFFPTVVCVQRLEECVRPTWSVASSEHELGSISFGTGGDVPQSVLQRTEI